MKLLLSLSFGCLFLLILVHGQEELPTSGDGSGEGSGDFVISGSGEEVAGSGSGDKAEEDPAVEEEEEAPAAEEEDPAAEEEVPAAEEEEGNEESTKEDGSGGEESGEADASPESDPEGEEEEEASGDGGSGEDLDEILTPESEASGDEEENENADENTVSEGSATEEASSGFGSCDVEGMEEKVRDCFAELGTKIEQLEESISSEDGGGLEDQIELVLVKKGVIDCENDTQCDDNRACLDSRVKRDRMLCEDPCERNYCPVQHSECVVKEHKFSCECKEGFHGNGTERCVPDGFTAEENGKHYRIFDDSYVTFDNATQQCQELGARLPVLDSPETIKIIKKYLEQSNFTVFEQWDRSSRRVWLGLIISPRSELVWVDGARIRNYAASSRLFVWEARRALSVESSYADHTRHYGLYIDGDIAKLPGGGRKGAAVLCELLPEQEASRPPGNYPYGNYAPGAAVPPPYQQPRDPRYPHVQPPQAQPYYPPPQQQPSSQPQRPGYNMNS